MERLTNEVLDNAIDTYKTIIKTFEETYNGEDYNPALDKCTLSFLEELKEYRNLEEQGLLLKLPCKVGDTVFGFQFPRTDMTVVSREKVERIAIETNDAFYDLEDFGEEFFLTKEEAEQALAEMEK